MIRAIGYLISELLWSLVDRVAPRQFPVDPDPESTAADVAARTKWIRENRPPPGERR